MGYGSLLVWEWPFPGYGGGAGGACGLCPKSRAWRASTSPFGVYPAGRL